MERVGFAMRIASEHVTRYVSMHRSPWPELVRALDRHGWRDYSLFLSQERLLVGYLRSADWPMSSAGMGAEPVSVAWSVEMDRLVDPGLPFRYRPTALIRSASATHGDPRRRCAMAPSEIAARDVIAILERAPASDALVGWSEFVVIDTGAGAALYGEHPPGTDRAWPIDGVDELCRIFTLSDLVDQLEGTQP